MRVPSRATSFNCCKLRSPSGLSETHILLDRITSDPNLHSCRQLGRACMIWGIWWPRKIQTPLQMAADTSAVAAAL